MDILRGTETGKPKKESNGLRVADIYKIKAGKWLKSCLVELVGESSVRIISDKYESILPLSSVEIHFKNNNKEI